MRLAAGVAMLPRACEGRVRGRLPAGSAAGRRSTATIWEQRRCVSAFDVLAFLYQLYLRDERILMRRLILLTLLALGATAARSLLQRVQTIDSLRQEVSRHSSGAWIYVTYHPSALLRAQADSTRLRGIVLSDLRRAVLQFERLAQEGT